MQAKEAKTRAQDALDESLQKKGGLDIDRLGAEQAKDFEFRLACDHGEADGAGDHEGRGQDQETAAQVNDQPH